MIIDHFPRDLLMTGAIFGIATFMWAGWAQERPPKHWIWRVILGVLSLAGAALAGISLPAAIRNWSEPTAITWGGTASTWYVVVFWVEVVVMVALSIWARRRRRTDLIAPLILAVVGIHFIPLAWVFAQPILAVAGVLMAIVAVVAALVPEKVAARSFWCGIIAAPILLGVGTACTIIAFGVL
nr:hypothetical protein [uncultured Microbacterium sp.]